ncbi:MAG: GAF domain-containing sensor histidine kinase [Actinomycetota bacterium]
MHRSVPAPAPAREKHSELVSLGERMGYLRAMRVGFAVIVLAVGAFAPDVRGVTLAALSAITGTYLLLLLAGPELARRLRRKDLLPVMGATLLIDGLYLGWVMYATGGAASPLRFLVYLHIVAVTLLGSYRTGLKIAAWHSLLFFVVFYAQSAGLLAMKETLLSALPGQGDFELVSMLNVAGLWAVALGTATFSAVNEREVRGQKIDLEQLSATVAEIDEREAPSDIPRILLDRLCEAFAFTRGAVLASPDSDELSVMAYRAPGATPDVPLGLDPVMEDAWNHKRTVLVREIDPDHDPRLAALFPAGRNLLIVPMFLVRGYRLGILVLEHAEQKDHIKRWTVAMVEQFASHAALSIHNAWLLDEVQHKLEENRALHAELMSQNLALELKVEERTQELSESLNDLRLVDAQRQRLLSRLVNAEEEERRRIAANIHDGPVQQIVNASMRLELLRKRLTDPAQVSAVDAISTAVGGSVDGLRNLLFDLRPLILDREGLESALLQYLRNLDGQLQVRVDNRLSTDPPDDLRIIMYRIAQEALANVRKHADATTVTLLIDQKDGGFLMRVQDDGTGFSPPEMLQSSPGHLGLSSMRERAEMAGGWCTVRSYPGGGTTVEFWVTGKQSSPNGSGTLEDAPHASLVIP